MEGSGREVFPIGGEVGFTCRVKNEIPGLVFGYARSSSDMALPPLALYCCSSRLEVSKDEN